MDYAVYERPELPPGTIVTDLSRSVSMGPAKEPRPDERVKCINRGRVWLHATFDSQHKAIPPGYFEIEYEAAKHFRGKLIVPGTKNIELGAFVSWIGILNVDADEKCIPFTDEQLRNFGEKVEAIDRTAMSLPTDREVVVLGVTGVQASSLSFSGSGAKLPTRGGIDTSVQATPEAAAAAAHVLDRVPLDQTAARQEQSEAAAEGRQRKR